MDQLFNEVHAFPGYSLTIDLERQVIVKAQGEEIPFEVNAFRKYCLINGLDDIGLTLRHKDKIEAFEKSAWRPSPGCSHHVIHSNLCIQNENRSSPRDGIGTKSSPKRSKSFKALDLKFEMESRPGRWGCLRCPRPPAARSLRSNWPCRPMRCCLARWAIGNTTNSTARLRPEQAILGLRKTHGLICQLSSGDLLRATGRRRPASSPS